MTAIVNNDIRVVSANQWVNAFQSTQYVAWQTATAYIAGDVAYNASYKYIATSAGNSGGVPPAHTSGTQSDGGVNWLFVEPFENTANFNNNLYLGIGKVTPWDNPGVGDEDPIDPLNDFASQYANLNQLISVKRMSSSSVTLAMKRYTWDATGSTIYSQFDPAVEGFNYATPMYVYADDNIYKCLNNAGGALSTVKPTGTNVDITTTADGYSWKFMFTVAPSDATLFLTPDYIPLALKLTDDGSAQWNTQQNAKKLSLSTIVVDNVGNADYTTAPITIDAPPAGTTATATAVIVGQNVTAINLTVIGEGYDTAPTVTIGGDGTGAAATAVLAPKDGHGFNALTELDARYAMVQTQLTDDEGGYFPITGESDFRQISLIVDPLRVDDSAASATYYIGPEHDDYDGVEGSGLLELKPGTGQTLYIEHIGPVVRTAGQIEAIKIALKF